MQFWLLTIFLKVSGYPCFLFRGTQPNVIPATHILCASRLPMDTCPWASFRFLCQNLSTAMVSRRHLDHGSPMVPPMHHCTVEANSHICWDDPQLPSSAQWSAGALLSGAVMCHKNMMGSENGKAIRWFPVTEIYSQMLTYGLRFLGYPCDHITEWLQMIGHVVHGFTMFNPTWSM